MKAKCPNRCDVPVDTLIHNCSKHERAIAEGRSFDCKIPNCTIKSQLTSDKEKV